MKAITILFGTQSGNAEKCAEQLGKILKKRKIVNRVVDMGDFNPKDLAKEQFVIIVTSTFGDGGPPSNAEARDRVLNGSSLPVRRFLS